MTLLAAPTTGAHSGHPHRRGFLLEACAVLAALVSALFAGLTWHQAKSDTRSAMMLQLKQTYDVWRKDLLAAGISIDNPTRESTERCNRYTLAQREMIRHYWKVVVQTEFEHLELDPFFENMWEHYEKLLVGGLQKHAVRQEFAYYAKNEDMNWDAKDRLVEWVQRVWKRETGREIDIEAELQDRKKFTVEDTDAPKGQ